MQNKKNMLLWIAIVLLVVAFLLFITIKKSKTSDQEGVGQNNMENIQQVDGVKITVLQQGTGDTAKTGDRVSMNYTGSLEDGSLFDSNVDPKFNHVEPFTFTLGEGQVIQGWDIGVEGMKVGEKRKLEINSEFAYGERGAGEAIPPNTKLIFEVELVEIIK